MSAAETTIVNKPKPNSLPWQLWLRQIAAIMRLELKKNFFGKRAVLVYLLALMPIGLLLLIAILPPAAREWLDFANYPALYAVIFNALILRTVIFFGCAWIFMNLFRAKLSIAVCTTISFHRCDAKCWLPGSIFPVSSPR